MTEVMEYKDLDQKQKQIVDQVRQITRGSKRQALQCLMLHDWNPDQAINHFYEHDMQPEPELELVSRDSIKRQHQFQMYRPKDWLDQNVPVFKPVFDTTEAKKK